MLQNYGKTILSMALLLTGCSLASAGTIDFEDAALNGGDDAAIDQSYFLSRGFQFTAIGGSDLSTAPPVDMFFESVGSDSGVDAYNGGGGFDLNRSGQPGDYLMRISRNGWENNTYDKVQLTIDYTEVAHEVSGEIWDIDDYSNEAYSATAYDQNGNVIATMTSPTSGTLDGEPWEFSFAVDDSTGLQIAKVELTSLGSKTSDVAFDNFKAHATPIPAALPLGAVGLAALAARRRSRRSKDENEATAELVD